MNPSARRLPSTWIMGNPPFEIQEFDKLLLKKGSWLGRGKLLVEGASLGEDVQVDLQVSVDEGGLTLSGQLERDFSGDVSIRVAPDEVGTYVIDARVIGYRALVCIFITEPVI